MPDRIPLSQVGLSSAEREVRTRRPRVACRQQLEQLRRILLCARPNADKRRARSVASKSAAIAGSTSSVMSAPTDAGELERREVVVDEQLRDVLGAVRRE